MPRLDEEGGVASTLSPQSPSGFGPGSAATPPDGLPPGARLNDMFEINRFIARGGMGAVYEGHNISSGERVAVKVLLASLLHDQRSWEMFRREANVLTRLSHPAIVQYRVLAKDAQLGLPYLVTEFIDGQPLSDRLRGEPGSVDDVLRLLRRLAEGLDRAHSLGAVHRDLSPDNILLPGGVLDDAKIIDFGIAKDLDSGVATIIGSGFAGKLGYCAPEQLGDYEQDIGPWTDVYSLGLIAYSTAVGKPVDMGVTLSQAVDRRRRGVDIMDAPVALRPLILAMLRPDPKERMRSMGEVLAAIATLGARYKAPDDTSRTSPTREPARAAPPAPAPTIEPTVVDFRPVAEPTPAAASPAAIPPAAVSRPATEATAVPARRWGLMATCGAGLVVFLAVAVVASGVGRRPHHPPVKSASRPAAATAVPVTPQLAGVFARTDCSLLSLRQLASGSAGLTLALAGTSSNPAALATPIQAALQPQAVARLDLDGVAPAPPALCPLLDALRAADSRGLTTSSAVSSVQPSFQVAAGADGTKAAQAVLMLNPASVGVNADLYLVGPDGQAQHLGDLAGRTFHPRGKATVDTLPDGQLRLTTPVSGAGLHGVVLVSGPGAGEDAAALQRQASGGASRLAAGWFTVVDPSPGAPGTAKVKDHASKPKADQDDTAPEATTPAAKSDDLNGLY
jgi:eukaryotic-like serine/threonine-protein kinase